MCRKRAVVNRFCKHGMVETGFKFGGVLLLIPGPRINDATSAASFIHLRTRRANRIGELHLLRALYQEAAALRSGKRPGKRPGRVPVKRSGKSPWWNCEVAES
jgi:hypothetical protein